MKIIIVFKYIHKNSDNINNILYLYNKKLTWKKCLNIINKFENSSSTQSSIIFFYNLIDP